MGEEKIKTDQDVDKSDELLNDDLEKVSGGMAEQMQKKSFSEQDSK